MYAHYVSPYPPLIQVKPVPPYNTSISTAATSVPWGFVLSTLR